jgi:hypothetical protein
LHTPYPWHPANMPQNEWMTLEAVEALHYCTTDFLPEAEVIQSACPKNVASRAVISRFKERMKIARKLGYLESLQKGNIKLIRLSEAGIAVVERYRLKRKGETGS